jgi:peptidoglycan/LPS O-acetylase OafA/YrhL
MAMLLSSALLLIPSFAIVNSETIRFGNFLVKNSMIAVTIILVVCIVLSVIFALISHRIYTEE